MTDFHAVIPAGGAGTRLWPLSRAQRPKFLLDLTGNGRSLIQQTWERLVTVIPADHIHVVSGPAHAPLIQEQLPQLANLYAEPAPRDSMTQARQTRRLRNSRATPRIPAMPMNTRDGLAFTTSATMAMPAKTLKLARPTAWY